MKALAPHYRGIPKAVKIGNFYFEVQVIDKDHADAAGFLGSTCPSEQRVLVGAGQTPQNLADTFIHEVMHGMCWVREIGDRSEHKCEEEDYVTHLAHAFCQFWQDNPEAVKWWARINSMVPA